MSVPYEPVVLSSGQCVSEHYLKFDARYVLCRCNVRYLDATPSESKSMVA